MTGFGWEVPAAIGVLILGILIAYGIYQYNRRNRGNDPVRDRATREIYQHPERYEQRTKKELDEQIHRS